MNRLDDHYDVRPHPIASGNYGVVKFAVHKRLQTLHAVKMLPNTHHMRIQAVQLAMIRSELDNHTKAAPGSRHICRLYESFIEPDSTSAVMELCTGGSLLQYVARQHCHTPANTRNLMRGLLHALAACCDAGVVHCDIKPSNIMLASPDAMSEVRLIDFGSSCVPNSRCKSGTLAYAAPEILRTGRPDELSDIWSAGMVLYQLLADGQLPCLLKSPTLEYPCHVPQLARDLVARMLVDEPTKRLHPYEAMGHPYFKT